MNCTKHSGRVVNIHASYSGGPGSNIDLETGSPDTLLVVFLSPSRQMPV
jgi:hypothetical protein